MKLYRAIIDFIQGVTRCLNAYAAILERPDPKPATEVFGTLPDEVQGVLEMARGSRSIRSKLPKEYQDMLDAEDLEG